MSLHLQKISRYSNDSQIMNHLELKVDEFKLDPGTFLYSDDFPVAGESTCCFKFNVSNTNKIGLWLISRQRVKINIFYTAMIFDEKKECLHGHMSSVTFKDKLCYKMLLESPSYRFIHFPLTIMCYLVIPNTGVLTVINNDHAMKQFAYKDIVPDQNTTKELLTKNINVPTECLQELSINLKKLLDQDVGTDIAIHVDGVTMKAHKMILRARSPVFEKMFDHDTSEADQNEIDIKDIRAPILKQLLTFLYTGAIENHDFDDAYDLYYAADKYEVLSLRNTCKKDLVHHLQVENACHLLSLATNHGDESFKEELLEYIKTNFKAIVLTKSFEELAKYDANLVVLLMRNHMLSCSVY